MNTVTMMDVQALQKRLERLEDAMESKVEPKLTIVPSKAKQVKEISKNSEEPNGFNMVIDISQVSEPDVLTCFFRDFKGKLKEIDKEHFTFKKPFKTAVECRSTGKSIKSYCSVTIHYINPDGLEENVSEFIQNHEADWEKLGRHYADQVEAMGLSKAEVARTIGCSATSVSSFFAGKPMKLAKMIECSLDLLIELYNHKKKYQRFDDILSHAQLGELV